ncbi:MAG TPA: arsenate reductase ArsC [Reyranella sp.]|jgi:arsenate reductase (thioredoxin)|nr:arsenate reductase ArsC [Reyranella sp.]
MSEQACNVLFLCTGNSARSILAESIVNHLGGGRFRGFSAGSRPKGEVHPYALDLLASLGFPTVDMQSKSWDVFAAAGAPHMDYIFTVCDNAAGEACPAWLGQPMTAHWGIPDPAAAIGSEADKRAAFRAAFASLESRIRIFMSLPFATLDGMTLRQRLDAIGHTPAGA